MMVEREKNWDFCAFIFIFWFKKEKIKDKKKRNYSEIREKEELKILYKENTVKGLSFTQK